MASCYPSFHTSLADMLIRYTESDSRKQCQKWSTLTENLLDVPHGPFGLYLHRTCL